MQSEARTSSAQSRVPEAAFLLAQRVARALGVSVEVWEGPASRREALHLGPACANCRESEPRTFDRCRKRRVYLSRQDVPVPARLAEKCSLGMRLARHGASAARPGPTLFAFGLPGGDTPEANDEALHAFLDAVGTLFGEAALDAASVPLRCLRAAAGALFAPAVPAGEPSGPTPAWLTDVLFELLARCEAQTGVPTGHAARVRALARLVGEELGLGHDILARLEWAAALHGLVETGSGTYCALAASGRGGAATAALRLHSLPTPWPAALLQNTVAAHCLGVADALEARFTAAAGTPRQRLQASLAALAAGLHRDPAMLAALGRLEPLLADHVWLFLLQRRR